MTNKSAHRILRGGGPCSGPALDLVQDMHRVYRWSLPSFWWTGTNCRPVSRCHSRRYSILCEPRWYPACLAPCVPGKGEANQAPLDAKPAIGLQQPGSSAIQCLVDSDCSMHPCHLGCLSLLSVLWTSDGLS